MATMQAIPKPGSYVLEWETVQLDDVGNAMRPLRRLLKNTPWIVQLDLVVTQNRVRYNFIAAHGGGGLEQWNMNGGDWVVKSPHGKVWFMSDSEFKGEFSVRAA